MFVCFFKGEKYRYIFKSNVVNEANFRFPFNHSACQIRLMYKMCISDLPTYCLIFCILCHSYIEAKLYSVTDLNKLWQSSSHLVHG